MNPLVKICHLVRLFFKLLFRGLKSVEHENAALKRLARWKQIEFEREQSESDTLREAEKKENT